MSQLDSDQWDFNQDHPYISTVLAAEEGWDSYLRLKEEISSRDKDADKEEKDKRVESLSPYDVLREASAWSMWESFRSQLGTKGFTFAGFSSIPESLEEGAIAEGTISVGNRELSLNMIFERGHWSIHSLEKLFSRKPVKMAYGPETGKGPEYFNEELSVYGVDRNPSFMNASYEGSAPISGGHGFVEFRVPKNRFIAFGWGFSLGYYNLSFDTSEGTEDLQYLGFSTPWILYLRYPMGDNKKEFVPYLGAGAALDVYTSLFSDFGDSDAPEDGRGNSFALVPRIGLGCDYLLPAKGWGAGLGLWKRFTLGSVSLNMGEVEIPELDDLSIRLYLLFRY
jgi:hypothetical protein